MSTDRLQCVHKRYQRAQRGFEAHCYYYKPQGYFSFVITEFPLRLRLRLSLKIRLCSFINCEIFFGNVLVYSD